MFMRPEMFMCGTNRVIAVLAAFAVAGLSSGAGAQMVKAPQAELNYSPIKRNPAPVIRAGLWDKPNEACITKCQVFVHKGCFKQLSEKDPTADAGAIQDICDDKYSVCLYDCMCDTCDENQIIIR